MTAKKTHGTLRDGRELTDDLLEELVANAERGYEPDQMRIRPRGGRPAIGTGPSSVRSFRLGPELEAALRGKAEKEGRTESDIMREALRRYLKAS